MKSFLTFSEWLFRRRCVLPHYSRSKRENRLRAIEHAHVHTETEHIVGFHRVRFNVYIGECIAAVAKPRRCDLLYTKKMYVVIGSWEAITVSR